MSAGFVRLEVSVSASAVPLSHRAPAQSPQKSHPGRKHQNLPRLRYDHGIAHGGLTPSSTRRRHIDAGRYGHECPLEPQLVRPLAALALEILAATQLE